MSAAVSPSDKQFLLDWYSEERRRIFRTTTPKPGGMLMGFPLWGAAYIHRFARYTVPSMLAPENIAALAGRSRLVIYTDEAGFEPICRIVKPLKTCAVEVEIQPLPKGWEAIKSKYSISAAASAILLLQAGHNLMSYHMTAPDVVLSANYYKNLSRLTQAGHFGIAQTNISCQIEDAADDLEKHRGTGGIITVQARDLGDIGLRHIHQQQKCFLMNGYGPDDMPPTPQLLWRCRDKVVIHCVHMNPDWLAPEVCINAPEPNETTIVGTLDVKLPYLLEEMPYVPTVDDDLTMVEFSDRSKPPRPGPLSFNVFANTAQHIMRFGNHYGPYFRRRSEVPIHEQNDFVDEAEVEPRMVAILDQLERSADRLARQSINARAEEIGWKRQWA